MQENPNTDVHIHNLDREKIFELLIALLLGIGLGALIYHFMKRRHEFLVEQEIDYENMAKPMLTAIASFPNDLTPQNRLYIAHHYVQRGDPISRDISIFFGFTALESHLSQAIDAKKPGKSEQAKGIVEKAAWYKDIDGISEEERSKIKHYTISMRNPLMHGQVYRGELAGEFLEFCEQIIYSKVAA